MLENLSERLQTAISKIKGYGTVTEDNIAEVMREIRLALLEADVNYQVVKEFTNNVKTKALGSDVKKSINPGNLFVKIMHAEIALLLGETASNIDTNHNPAKIMLVGLQGSGKTTTIGKLALYLRKKQHKKPLLVACDIYRPGAIEQLQQIGKELNIEVFEQGHQDPARTVTAALEHAKLNHFDLIMVDTAGRLHIDEPLMQELINVNSVLKAHEILLVIDSMMGQDAINVINGFNEALPLTGTILTKMDGDARGGVALSVRHLTNLPIKMVGISEKMDGLTEFDPDRIADRILGMGDIVGLVSEAEAIIDQKEAGKTIRKMQTGKYDLEDFLSQMQQMKKIGNINNLLKMIPGASKMGLNKVNIDPKQMARIEAIVLSMTPKERRNPSILKASRKQRIAKGSGVQVAEVNRLLNQFEQSKELMKKMANGKMKMPF